MKPWKKTAIWILVVIVCSGASFLGGSYKAYWAGMNRASTVRSCGSAMYDAIILKYLREQKTDTVIKLLEGHLDGDILEYNNYRNFGTSIFDKYDPLFFDQVGTMKVVVDYRKQYPSTSPKDIKEAVDSDLAQFEKEK